MISAGVYEEEGKSESENLKGHVRDGESWWEI